MKKITLIGLCLLLVPIALQAQREYEQWMVGDFLGMKFTGGVMSPLPAGTNTLNCFYGAASICDASTGSLLFYTNGNTVKNGNHQTLTNGTGLVDDPTAVYSLIVPWPGRSKVYFLFTINPRAELHYAEVDMNTGAVLSKKTLVADNIDHHMAAVRQKAEDGYWLITHTKGNNEFWSFRINKNGIQISNPVKSAVGTNTFVDNVYRYGNMVSNSRGDELIHCFAHGTGGQFEVAHAEVFDIDKTCGQLSFKTTLNATILQDVERFAYAAYSPNDKYAYVSFYYSATQSYRINQYDMSLAPANINGSKIEIGTGLYGMPDMQLAMDGNIYVASADGTNSTSLISVIEGVNSSSITFTVNKYDLSPGGGNIFTTERWPGMIQDKSKAVDPTQESKLQISKFCKGDQTSFAVVPNFPPLIQYDSLKWEYGDGAVSRQGLIGTHTYADTGLYQVVFTWYRCGLVFQLKQSIRIGLSVNLELGPDTTICKGTPLLLSAGSTQYTYLWSTGSTAPDIMVNQPGMYKLTLSSGNCSISDSVRVNNFPDIWSALGEEYFICDKDQELVKLDAGEKFQRYKWYPTGDTTQWIEVGELGNYFVILGDFRACPSVDSTEVKRRCQVLLYFPNAFSPDGDLLNDVYKPVGDDVLEFSMRIYNRWGQLIFESEDPQAGWDGTYKGAPAPEGVYACTVVYRGYVKKALRRFSDKTDITLMR